MSGTLVNAEGWHTLVVTDQSGNTTTVTFTIDKTAPTVLDEYPDVKNDLGNSINLLLGTDEDTTAYFVVLVKGSSSPSENQIIAGTDIDDIHLVLSGNASLNANTEEVININGLDKDSSYEIFVVVIDKAGNKSMVHGFVLNRP
ncbi:hypothetical protein [Brevibacillus choshinensis]|uniref:Uncharacterized protein n=1 Tax=Brevibacillus choshinensis TaxID=54911 RepID=A0ABX7FGA4_BRECH|nr:hypothetical protein [Brevibacillus choshinensis]QRG65233.1 hypothetical protein JNE38_16445 [Brevibacillus choshinensis]